MAAKIRKVSIDTGEVWVNLWPEGGVSVRQWQPGIGYVVADDMTDEAVAEIVREAWRMIRKAHRKITH